MRRPEDPPLWPIYLLWALVAACFLTAYLLSPN